MKTNSRIFMALMLALLATSCRNKDDHMLTVINEDGTCSREYTFKTTQQWLAASADEDYDSIIDKSWERTWSVQGTDSVRYPVPLTEAQLDSMQELDLNKPLGNMLLVHAKKTYDSVEEMSAELYRSDNHHLKKVEGIKATSTLEKSFKWFYTDYTFSETFTYEGEPIFPIPLSDFTSADTASFWFTGQPDLTQYLSGAEQKELLDKIEKKISQWSNANWFYEICNIIIDNYDSIQNTPVSKERFTSLRDSLVMQPSVLNAVEEDSNPKAFLSSIEGILHTDVYTNFLKTYEGGPAQYAQLLSFGYPYDLVMPGTVTDAGMGEYDGKVIHYQLGGERLISGPYTITASSRVANVWAYIVTALIILLALGSLFLRKK
ncbi:hypothetical protein L6470_12190 [Prevotella communis]|uniref:hypothetical protein n=1 Tax=Prevotella communis TaxID=2913614 RepID=UPI001EDB29CE|nr:hypothetical protein [Prevotella communis]UKK59109.1 hypothetical protein L6470_12190 [Prevotella communis]